MAISRERKEELLGQYIEELRNSSGIILTEYRGMSVAQLESLRRLMRKNDATFRVVKNNLFEFALNEVGLEMIPDWKKGPVGVAFCHGEVPSTVKAMIDFTKESPLLVFRGGLVESRPVAADKVKELAALPSREVLLGQVLGTINAPASQVVGVVASGIRQVLNVLQAYVDKLEGGSPEPQAA